MKEQITIKIWRDTRLKLRLISDLTDKSICEIVDELIDREIQTTKESNQFKEIEKILNGEKTA